MTQDATTAQDARARDGAAQDRAAQDRAAQDGAAQDGAAQDGAAQDGAAQQADQHAGTGAARALLRRRRAGRLPVRLVTSFEDDLAGLHSIAVHTHVPYGVVWLELAPQGDPDDPATGEALRACAAAVAGVCRSEDGVHRTGPAELVLLVPGADLPDAAGLAERVLLANTSPAVTLRAGVAAFRPGTGQSAPEVADEARRRVRSGGAQREA